MCCPHSLHQTHGIWPFEAGRTAPAVLDHGLHSAKLKPETIHHRQTLPGIFMPCPAGTLFYRIGFRELVWPSVPEWCWRCHISAVKPFMARSPGITENTAIWRSSEVLLSLLRGRSLTPCKLSSTCVTSTIRKLCAFNAMGILRLKLSHKIQSSEQWRLDLKAKKSPSYFTIILTTAECQQRSCNNAIVPLLTCSTSVPDVLHQINYLVSQLNPYWPRWGLCHSHFRKKEGYFELFFKN